MTDVTTTTAGPPAAPWALGAGFLLSIVLVAIESISLSTVMPQISADLKGLELYGWASSAFMLSGLFGAVLTGLVFDRRGIAAGAALSLTLLGAGLVVVGLAPSMLILVGGRFIEGLGVGGLNVLPFAVLNAAYRGAAQARMLAALAFAWLIPGLAGPWLASQIAELWSWRAVVWCLVALLVIVTPLCVVPLRAIRTAGNTPARKRQLGYASGLVLFTGLLLEGLRRTDLLAVPLVALGGLGLVWAWKPLFPSGILHLRGGLPAALALRGGLAYAMMGTSPFLTLALTRVHGLSLEQAGWMLSIGSISWTLGASLQARLERLHHPKTRLNRIGWAACGVTTGLLVVLDSMTGLLPIWAAYLGWFSVGVCMGVGYNSNSLYALASVPPEQSGQLSSQMANMETIMVGIATGIGGALIARIQPTSTAITLILGLNILVSLLPWLAVQRQRLAAASG